MSDKIATMTETQTQPITLIRQAELREYQKLDDLVEKKTKELADKKKYLIGLIASGIEIEKGKLTAEVKLEERRTPKWKDIAVNLANKLFGAGNGPSWADEVIQGTQPSTIQKLIIK